MQSRRVRAGRKLCCHGLLVLALTSSRVARAEEGDPTNLHAFTLMKAAGGVPRLAEFETAPKFLVPGQEAPPGYVLEDYRRWDLAALGASFFVMGYGAPVAIAAGLEFSEDSEVIAVPVFGPLVLYGRLAEKAWEECCTLGLIAPMALTSALLAATTLQAGGLVLVGMGLFRKEQRWVRASEPLSFEPWIGPRVRGARMTLTF